MQKLYENLRIWRVIASLFAFSSSPELIFGVALLYYFRVFERQIGSNKYAVSKRIFMLKMLHLHMQSLYLIR